MIISCPSCGASFNVKREALGPTGRSVKCSKCAHRWHATQDDGAEENAPAAAAEDTTAEETAASDQTSEASEETASDEAGAETAEEESAEANAPDEPAGEEEAGEESAAAEAGEADDEAQSEDVPEGMAAALGLAAEEGAPDEEEPARRRRKPATNARKPRRSMAKVLSLFVLLLLVGSVAGAAFFFNQKIMMWMPATQRLYSMVGMKPHVLGQGLKIVERTPKKEIDGNDEILVVEGEIRNTTEKAIDIPLMRGALLDKQGKELHIWTFTAAKSKVAPGENARYRTEFRNPPTTAESLDITFTRANAVMEASKQDAKAEMKPDETTGKESPKAH